MADFLKVNNANNSPVYYPQAQSGGNMRGGDVPNNLTKSPYNNFLPDNSASRVFATPVASVGTSNYAKLYDELYDFLDDSGKKALKILHSNKKLISNKSNDNSSTIDNLYKIMKQPRAAGFDPKIVLTETVKVLADPYIITQDFGKIPEFALPQLISDENARVAMKQEERKQHPLPKYENPEILKPLAPLEEVKNKGINLSKQILESISPKSNLKEVLNTNSEIFEQMKTQSKSNPQAKEAFDLLKSEVTDFVDRTGLNLSTASKTEDIMAVNYLLLSILQVKAALNPAIQAQITPQITNFQKEFQTISQEVEDINFSKGHTCPAASIEFDLADKKPAEFARYVERLTSPEKAVKTKVKYTNIADDLPAAISRMIDWKLEYKRLNSEDFEITLRPDQNAYARAIIQEYGRAKDSRSVVDSILQSTFMQAGSKRTYNSLTDLRSEDVGDGRGLNQEEGAVVESIVDYEGGKDSVTYMELDDNLTKINKYNFDGKTTENMLTEALNRGKNIMVGFLTDVEANGNLATSNGHEVLLTGLVQDKTGKKFFKYNDTDDGNNYAPSFIDANELIRSLHHANLPRDIVRKYITTPANPRLSLIADYWNLKKQNIPSPQSLQQA